MKLLAVTFSYYPDMQDFKRNIGSYIGGVDHLIIWENTDSGSAVSYRPDLSESENKVSYMGIGKNVGIAFAVNRAIDWGIENGYTHILTMDQDSTWNDFGSFRMAVEQSLGDSIGVYAPTIVLPDGAKLLNMNATLTSGSIYPLDLFREIGRFREDFEIDCVDTEICYRMRTKGYSIKYFDNVLNHTLGHNSVIAGNIKTHNYSPYRLYHIARNELILVKEYSGKGISTNYNCITVRLKLLKQIILIMLGEKDKLKKIKAIIKGYMDARKYKID